MYSSLFFSNTTHRPLLGLTDLSSPTVSSKCSVAPLCLSRTSSNLISLWRLPHPAPAAITIAPVRFFSASDGVGVSAGEHLKCIIQAQIRRGEAELDTEFFVPKDFPFAIVDNSDEQMITLRRKYSGENIEVEVNLPDWLHKKEKVEEDEEYIDLTIKIDKGENTYLEFRVCIFSKGIDIEGMLLKSHQVLEEDTQKYEGPDIWNLEETLYKAALKYLKAKGIDGSLWEFLKKYMMDKNDREHLDWLKKIDFTFEIVDNSGEQMITLRRKYSGENIEVEVNLTDWLHKKEKVEEDEEYIDLTIKIDKGENTYLKFRVCIFSKGIDIEGMLLKSHQVLEEDTQKYEGPDIWNLDETLYKAAVKYLKAKGIDGSLWEFLKKVHDGQE